MLGGCGGDNDSGKTKASVGVLFALSAERGTLKPAAGSGDSFTLTLGAPASRVVAFTDRPVRRAATATIQKFVGDGWGALGFDKDPPNAALVLDDVPEDEDTTVFEIADPSYDRKADSLTYRATRIKGRDSALPEQEVDEPADQFGAAHLLVDSGSAIGPGFAIGSIFELKQHKDNPTQ